MKIAMIGQKGPVLNEYAGGIERHVVEITKRLIENGHAVTIYSRSKYVDNNHDDALFHIKIIPTIYNKYLETIVYTFFATLHALFQNYDIIHYHGVGPATLAWIPRLFARRAKIIITFHSLDRMHEKWGIAAKLFLYFGEFAAVFFSHYCLVTSVALKKYIQNHYGVEAVYIPNGATIKIGFDDNLLRKFSLKKDDYILTVSRLVPQKRIELLIDAYKRIKTDKKLVIVGAPGFVKDYYVKLRQVATGNDNIKFLGFQEGETLDQLYANTYLFVQPSDYEGLSVALLEAMSHGAAVLVSNIEANLETVKDAGFVFAAGDVIDLTDKIRYLLSNPAAVAIKKEESILVVKKYYTWDKIAEEVESVYITARH